MTMVQHQLRTAREPPGFSPVALWRSRLYAVDHPAALPTGCGPQLRADAEYPAEVLLTVAPAQSLVSRAAPTAMAQRKEDDRQAFRRARRRDCRGRFLHRLVGLNIVQATYNEACRR